MTWPFYDTISLPFTNSFNYFFYLFVDKGRGVRRVRFAVPSSTSDLSSAEDDDTALLKPSTYLVSLFTWYRMWKFFDKKPKINATVRQKLQFIVHVLYVFQIDLENIDGQFEDVDRQACIGLQINYLPLIGSGCFDLCSRRIPKAVGPDRLCAAVRKPFFIYIKDDEKASVRRELLAQSGHCVMPVSSMTNRFLAHFEGSSSWRSIV